MGSLQCRRIFGGRNIVRVRNIVIAAIFDFKIGESGNSESFNMALSRAKTFARPKKTPALQAMFWVERRLELD